MSCPDCFSGSAKDGTPAGSVKTIHGMTAYVSTPSPKSTVPRSPSVIIIIPDAFGYKFLNNQLLADVYANVTGMDVIIPDCVPGTGMAISILPIMDIALGEVAWWNVIGQIRRVVAFVRFLAIGVPFIIKAKTEKAYPSVLEWTRNVHGDLKEGGKLGVAGFCWGGKISTDLCTETLSAEGGEGDGKRLVDAHFSAHPSRVDMPGAVVDSVSKFKVPFALAAAEKDGRLSMKVVDELEATLRQKLGNGQGENGYYFEIEKYTGAAHGFAVRARPENEDDTKGAERATIQATEWFKRWL